MNRRRFIAGSSAAIAGAAAASQASLASERNQHAAGAGVRQQANLGQAGRDWPQFNKFEMSGKTQY